MHNTFMMRFWLLLVVLAIGAISFMVYSGLSVEPATKAVEIKLDAQQFGF